MSGGKRGSKSFTLQHHTSNVLRHMCLPGAAMQSAVKLKMQTLLQQGRSALFRQSAGRRCCAKAQLLGSVHASGPASNCQQPLIARISSPAVAAASVRGIRSISSSRIVMAAATSAQAAVQLPASFQESYVDLAHALADAAAEVTRKYFRSPFDVETKKDASPVTIADKQAELAMRDLLAQRVPEHGVFGEEHGIKMGYGAGADYVWVLDPIDGTKSFITGKPLFGTLVSLVYKGTPILGIIDQPILKERWVGVAGRPSTLNGQVIKTRACADIENAYLYATTPHMFAGATEASFNKLRDSVKIPMYGCDCYAYGLLAAGFADIVCEADLKPYDYMALIPIIKGAGGVVTDWRGSELSWWPSDKKEVTANFPGEVLACGDARAHAQALQKLAF